MAEVQLPDGNIAKIPDFALEATQRKMHDLIEKMVDTNSKSHAALDKINKSAVNAVKTDKQLSDQALQEQKRQTKLLDTQAKNNQNFRTVLSSRIEADMTRMFAGTGNVLTGLAKGALVATAAITGVFLKSFMDAGNNLRQLTTVGLGSDGIVGAISSFTELGMSTKQAADTLSAFSASASILGRNDFSRFVSNMASATSISGNLGLSLEEAVEVIGEEIDIRRMGATQRLNLDVAERSAIEQRIQQTFALSAVTGKSIREIAASSREFFKSNARVAGALLALPAEAAQQVRSGIDFGVRVGASVGDEFGLMVNTVFQGASAMIPAATQEFQDIMQVPAISELGKSLLDMNRAIRSGSLTQEQSREQVVKMAKMLSNLSQEQIGVLEYQSMIGNQTANTVLNAALQIKGLGEDGIKRMLAEKVTNDKLFTSVANLQNAFSKLRGIFGTVFLRAVSGLAGPMEALAKILDETEDRADGLPSVFGALKTAVDGVFNALMEVFGVNLQSAGDDVEKMAEAIREKLVPWIQKTGENLEKWILSLKDLSTGDKLKKALLDGFNLLFSSAIEALASTLGRVIEEHKKEILLGVGALIAVNALIFKSIGTAGKGAATAIRVAGGQLATALRQVAAQIRMSGGMGGFGGDIGDMDGDDGKRRRRGGRKGRGLRLGRLAGRASVAGIATGLVGGMASDYLYEQGNQKAAAGVDIAAQTIGMAGTGAMIGGGIGALFGGVGAAPGAAIGGAMGAVAGLGTSIYQNWNIMFDTPQSKQFMKENGFNILTSMISPVGGLTAMMYKKVTESPRAMNFVKNNGMDLLTTMVSPIAGLISFTSKKLTNSTQAINFVKNTSFEAMKIFGSTALGMINPTAGSLFSMGSLFVKSMAQPTTPALTAITPNTANQIMPVETGVNYQTMPRTYSDQLLVELNTQIAEMNTHLRNIRNTNRDIRNSTQ